MSKFEIWMEGYAATGDSSDADYFGTVEAESFQEACDKFFAESTNEEHKKFYDPKTLSWWGCKLFDNEKDARRSFG